MDWKTRSTANRQTIASQPSNLIIQFETSLSLLKRIKDIKARNLTQVTAYADNVVIVSRNSHELRKSSLELNEYKTKHMRCTKADRSQHHIIFGTYSFEEVKTFKYLRTLLNRNNLNVNLCDKVQKDTMHSMQLKTS